VSIPAPAAEKQGFVSGEKHRAMGGEIQESFACRRMEAAGAPLPPRRWSTRRAVEQLGVAWESSDGIRKRSREFGAGHVRREAGRFREPSNPSRDRINHSGANKAG
jgi:hypothetical protein